jgi:hypothetical protein
MLSFNPPTADGSCLPVVNHALQGDWTWPHRHQQDQWLLAWQDRVLPYAGSSQAVERFRLA